MNVFQSGKNSTHELRSGNHLQRVNIQTMNFGSKSIQTPGAKIWDFIPVEIKASKPLMIFKKKIKSWTPKSCPCCLCRIYIGQVGFINQHLPFCEVPPPVKRLWHASKQNTIYLYIYIYIYIYIPILHFMYTVKNHKHIYCRSFLLAFIVKTYKKLYIVFRLRVIYLA